MQSTFRLRMMRVGALWLLLAIGLPAHGDRYDDAVGAAGRAELDRSRDELREPAAVLRAIGIEPGTTVLDVGAGDGYYSEMLSFLAGPDGRVLVENPSVIYQLYPQLKPALQTGRLADGRLANASLLDDEMTSLSLADGSVDLVFFHLIYHDMFWMYPDRVAEIDAEVARVLSPGGRVVIVDHRAPPGTGAKHALEREEGSHRIDPAYVEQAMADVGLRLSESYDLLAHPEDDRTQAFYAEALQGKPTDRFFHIYQKPLEG